MPAAQLIATKLNIPSLRSGLVRRNRLFPMLDDGLQVPLTLMAAPAGFGKSMLAADWSGITRRISGQVAFPRRIR